MFRPESPAQPVQKPRLYLIPSTFGEEYDPEFSPKPTSSTELPDINELTFQLFTMSLKFGLDAEPHHKSRLCVII